MGSCTQLVVLYAPFKFGSEYNFLELLQDLCQPLEVHSPDRQTHLHFHHDLRQQPCRAGLSSGQALPATPYLRCDQCRQLLPRPALSPLGSTASTSSRMRRTQSVITSTSRGGRGKNYPHRSGTGGSQRSISHSLPPRRA